MPTAADNLNFIIRWLNTAGELLISEQWPTPLLRRLDSAVIDLHDKVQRALVSRELPAALVRRSEQARLDGCCGEPDAGGWVCTRLPLHAGDHSPFRVPQVRDGAA